MAGQLSHKSCGQYFAKSSTKASSNYGVGPDGKIGMYVEEKDRSWASSNGANDNRAVTIEVASDSYEPYRVTDKAYNATIQLVADICKRNGIKELKWKADPKLIGQVDKQNMTVHRWFKQKACPGNYLYSRMGDIANKVNTILKGQTPSTTVPSNNTSYSYTPANQLVRVIEKTGLSIRKGPGTNYDKVGEVPYNSTYTITAFSGDWGKLKSGAGWINCNSKYVQKVNSSTPANSTISSGKPVYKVGQNYVLLEDTIVRKGPGNSYMVKSYSELTTAAKKLDKDKNGSIDKGATVTCQEIRNVSNEIWMRIPSGWVCAYSNNTIRIR